MTETTDFLAKVELFKSLPEADLQRLAAQMRQISLPQGDIIRDRDASDGLYIVKSGMAKVTKGATETAGVEAVLAILREGNSFGELSLIDGQPRSANVTAMGPMECYFLPRDAFLVALRENPQITYVLLTALAGMVRNADQWVAQLI